ncbi:methylphosphotriester-DNA--protein-cysteine methyltransferase family protein [Paenibacillus zeisoli]|uniref:Methylphosphotriester-DNA--protein-cysteine methyltransferase family protein n=1 Tax=Paenibacillus zeisoli TaxID=2496267 RepID=A0A3S1JSA6_9BACL|nr:bifunctional transcriptional activator/DNA repair enzyme AdaA [Paenibacillus zeisoli]RUT35554.1 methylphosphotriester-DNA--protein-cysteine methyltransferase family protein [Paenibacillus zeisoli]
MKDEFWEAIITNNASYDDQFLYAVKTTGIFCRPSCKSREPNRQNVRLFRSAEEAIRADYRPCKRCKPAGKRLPNEDWVAQITDYIDLHYHERLSLQLLADLFHGSPYHLHRTFKRITDLTPVEYIQRLRVKKAQEMLDSTDYTVGNIGFMVGIPSSPYFITLFKKITGYTPAEYRQRHNRIDLGGGELDGRISEAADLLDQIHI